MEEKRVMIERMEIQMMDVTISVRSRSPEYVEQLVEQKFTTQMEEEMH